MPTATEKLCYQALILGFIRRRIAKGWTQEQLDVLLGVTDGQVAKWETFMRLPGAFMLSCWASALDLQMLPVHLEPADWTDERCQPTVETGSLSLRPAIPLLQ